MLTLIGVMFNYVFYFLLGYYTPHLTGVAPAWVYFVSAFCIFAYQSLDNIDGRQARRCAPQVLTFSFSSAPRLSSIASCCSC
jgi:phosphatidylglycerophosphate synthase